MSNDSLGPRLASYGASRSFAFAGWFISALLAGTGGFLFWLAAQARSGKLTFTGNLELLYQAGGALIGVAVVVAILFAIIVRRRVTVHAHANGLHAVSPGRDQVDLYRDLDVYLAPTGLFGYRGPGAPWVLVDNRVSRMAELRQRLLDGQLAHRLPLLRDQLARGGAVTFRYFSTADNQHQAMWNPRKVDLPTQDLVLTPQTLTVAGKTIPLAHLARVTPSTWRDQVTFTDTGGTVLHAMPATSVLSLALLCAVLETLQAQR